MNILTLGGGSGKRGWSSSGSSPLPAHDHYRLVAQSSADVEIMCNADTSIDIGTSGNTAGIQLKTNSGNWVKIENGKLQLDYWGFLYRDSHDDFAIQSFNKNIDLVASTGSVSLTAEGTGQSIQLLCESDQYLVCLSSAINLVTTDETNGHININAQANVNITTVTGDVHITPALGNIELKPTIGGVELITHTGNGVFFAYNSDLILNTFTGNISVAANNGKIDVLVNTGTGEITIKSKGGNIDIWQDNGADYADVWLKNNQILMVCTEEFDLISESSVGLVQAHGHLTLQGEDIEITTDSGNVVITATSGNILLFVNQTHKINLVGLNTYTDNTTALAALGAAMLYRNGDNLCITH
jgi:uncharacterized protein (DUF2345 family)